MWLYGAFGGLFFTLFFALPGGDLYFWSSLFLFASSFTQGITKTKSITLIVSGFLWTAYYNAPRVKGERRKLQVLNRSVIASTATLTEDAKGDRSLVWSKPDCYKTKQEFYLARDYGELFYPVRSYFYASSFLACSESFILGTSLQESLAHTIRARLQSANELAPWLKSLLLGDRRGLDYKIHIIFSTLGLYHLLVLSGLHISFLGFFLYSLFSILIRLSYALRLMSPRFFIFSLDLAKLGVCALLFIYASCVEFSVPVQRAFLSYFIYTLLSIFCLKMHVRERFQLILFFQIFCFPIGFLDNSTFLSWGSFFVVLFMFEGVLKKKIWSFFLGELLLMALVGVCCGKLSILGLLLNPIFVPVFSFVYCFSLLVLFKEIFPPSIIVISLEVQRVFLSVLKAVSILPQQFTWLHIDLFTYSSLCRSALLLPLLWFFYYLLKSIKEN